MNTFGSQSFLENFASRLTVNCGLSYSAFKHLTRSSRFFRDTCVSVGLVSCRYIEEKRLVSVIVIDKIGGWIRADKTEEERVRVGWSSSECE